MHAPPWQSRLIDDGKTRDSPLDILDFLFTMDCRGEQLQDGLNGVEETSPISCANTDLVAVDIQSITFFSQVLIMNIVEEYEVSCRHFEAIFNR